MNIYFRKNSLYLEHNPTSWWYWGPSESFYQYWLDSGGWEPGTEEEGAALVAPHPMLKWSDEDEMVS